MKLSVQYLSLQKCGNHVVGVAKQNMYVFANHSQGSFAALRVLFVCLKKSYIDVCLKKRKRKHISTKHKNIKKIGLTTGIAPYVCGTPPKCAKSLDFLMVTRGRTRRKPREVGFSYL